jgi:hypothetical protein
MHMHCCRTCRLIKLDTVGSNASFQHLSRPNAEWGLVVTIGCLPGGNRLATPNAVRVSRFLWESCHGVMEPWTMGWFFFYFSSSLSLSLSSLSRPPSPRHRHTDIAQYRILYLCIHSTVLDIPTPRLSSFFTNDQNRAPDPEWGERMSFPFSPLAPDLVAGKFSHGGPLCDLVPLPLLVGRGPSYPAIHPKPSAREPGQVGGPSEGSCQTKKVADNHGCSARFPGP